ncbi:MAG: DUF721 domain-containing protein [Sphingopyxis sp.]
MTEESPPRPPQQTTRPAANPATGTGAPAGKGAGAGKVTGKGAGAARTRPERPRGGEARRIADLVPAIGDTAFRKFGFVQSAIITRWPEIVGTKLAHVTAPESLRFPVGKKADGTLHITVGGAHAPIVQHVLPDIIARVNQFFGYAAVARVRLSQGVVKRPRMQPAQTPRAAASPAQTANAAPPNPMLKTIGDPELRAVLEGLASSLAKRDGLPKIS